MQAIQKKVFARIRGKRQGWVFTPRSFLDLGPRKSVDMALSRLEDSGKIRRLARGLYDYPQTHPKLGLLSPSPDVVARALASASAVRLQPSGAYAMNLLGLSTQVPAKVVYLTEGPGKVVLLGKQSIQLKRTTPRNMAAAGSVSGLVIQALRHLGRQGVTAGHLATLRRRLSPEERKRLWRDRVHAPAWMHGYFAGILAEEG